MKIVLVTGGFDPIHSGHISYLNHADHLGDHVVVGLNSDEWLTRKKGRPFMSWKERMIVLDNLHMVGEVIAFDDSDGTAIDAIRKVKEKFPNDEIIFANGGDRTKDNIPEMVFDDVEFVFGVGGSNKANSSSWILEEWKSPKTERPWGWYRVLDDKPGYKVKELVIEPGKRLSMQRHAMRAEHWYILKGKCDIVTDYFDSVTKVTKYANESYVIEKDVWHQGQNNYNEDCHILEVQYGDQCVESDIERRDQ
jgi:D-beta-D-heptose 7-phosphate kinase/D-beta-D-heptose 1-phosphate adenosyltransferase